MKKNVFTVKSVTTLTRDVFELRLDGDTSDITVPGQFAEITVPGLFLRRPISICDWSETGMVLLVKNVGRGTDAMNRLHAGDRLDVIAGLGNGFSVADIPGSGCALVGGGIGTAPLFALAKAILAGGRQTSPVKVILGFRTSADVFYEREFKDAGCDVTVVTEDGSYGEKGFVTDSIRAIPGISYLCACGPLPMLKALTSLPGIGDGQLSLEARMGCGFGACVGCTVRTASGFKRVCKEGPVFKTADLIWE